MKKQINIKLPSNFYTAVNAKFQGIFTNMARYLILWGGRGSGKSFAAAVKMLYCMLTMDEFTGVFLRKTYNSIYESQYRLFKAVTEKFGVSEHFNFYKQPLIIEFKYDDSRRIICKGLDDAEKLKSLTDIDLVHVEECNALSLEDFLVTTSSMRNVLRPVQEIYSLNPQIEGDFTQFWLFRMFFNGIADKTFNRTIEAELDGEKIKYNVSVIHSTHKDNPYLDSEYRSILENYKLTNPYHYETLTLGEWAIKITEGSFFNQFSRAKHVGKVGYNADLPVFISIDNNVLPYVSVSFFQYDDHRADGGKCYVSQFHEIAAREPHNSATKAAELVVKYLRKIQYSDVLFVCGDYSTKNRSTVDEEKKSFFKKFTDTLESKYKVRDKIKSKNPPVAITGEFINAVLDSNYDDLVFTVDESCKESITDYIMCKTDKDGSILKKRITDKNGLSYEQYGHLTDCARYFFTQVFDDSFLAFRKGYKDSKNINDVKPILGIYQTTNRFF